MASTISMKNTRTGLCDTIRQHDIRHESWGLSFLVDFEIEAYKAAYQYRHNPHGVQVAYAEGAKKWMVTVFNADAAAMGIDAAK